MQSKKLAKPKPGPNTVSYLDIAEIRDDMVMLKDNHIDMAGGIRAAIENVKKYLKEN